jgi:homoserine kinase
MKFTIKVPATSANLGPGFDTLGLALDLWNETSLSTNIGTDERTVVRVQGEGAGWLAPNDRNLIARTARQLAERLGKTLPPFQADCANQIPLSSGLGSSAATILTGLLAGNILLENPLSQGELLDLAAELEGHPDNVAPALLGGLVVSTVQEGKVIAHPIPVSKDICITIALPDVYITTKQARASLPKKVAMKNAVYNISRAVLVTEAFRTGDLGLLGKAMTDRLHQPYRLKLIPGAGSALEAAREAGAAAVALSGAGPSLIAFSSKAEPGIGEAMQQIFERAGLATRVFHLGVSERGAEIHSA